MTECGVIYYATGEEYVRQAKRSAASLHEHMDIAVTVYSDRPVDSPHVDNVVEITPGDYPFYDRINYFKQTPYDQTLYLDTDTYITGDLSPIFELLDRVEVAAAFNESRNTAAPHTKFETVDLDVPPSFPEYQCGVIGYRDTKLIQKLFDDWQSRYEPYRDAHLVDQPHFREAVYNTDVSVGTLPTEFNTLANFGGYLHDKVRILHYAGANRSALGSEPPDDEQLQAFVDRLNRDAPQNRLFLYDALGCLHVPTTHEDWPLTHTVATSVQRNGIQQTIKRATARLKRLFRS